MPIELDNINMITHYDSIMDKLSSIKLIVMDLDGTVLDHSNNAEDIQELASLCESLRKLNVMSMVATGRTLMGSKHIIERLIGHQDIPIITYNGSVTIHNTNSNIIDQKFIPDTAIREILTTTQSYRGIKNLFYYFEDNIMSHNEYVKGWTDGIKDKLEFNQQIVTWVDNIFNLYDEDSLPSAILIDIINCPMKQKIIHELKSIHEISVTSSGNRYIEIRPDRSDKGTALNIVSNYLGIDYSNILTIGDNDNDVEMLKYSGVGVSISNGSNLAKSNSDFITTSGAFEGVLEILRLVLEVNRLKGKKKNV
jgi:Cof subfamily protein (haloacid dehalogenase superfamily)